MERAVQWGVGPQRSESRWFLNNPSLCVKVTDGAIGA